MGKKRIIKKSGEGEEAVAAIAPIKKSRGKHLECGRLYIQSTYNNTTLLLTDLAGGTVLSASAGSLGFKGAKKGTPFAAGKVAEQLADKAANLGLKEVEIVIKGIGAGRESALRTFAAKGFVVNSIKDATPIPFNGPRPPKPRRV